MIYLIIIIILLTFILYFIYKDYLKVLIISSIITGISGLLTGILGYLVRFFINNMINFINISKVTNIILTKFLKNSIYLLVLSLTELVIYVSISYYLDKKKLIGNKKFG